MGLPTTDSGASLQVFAAEQASLKAIASGVIPGAGDAMLAINCSAAPSGKSSRPRDAKMGTSTKIGRVPLQRGYEGTIEFELIPGGSLLAVPDHAVLWENGGFERVTGPSATTVSGGSSTTTRVDLASTTGVVVGMYCSVEISSVRYWRRITAVDSVGTDVIVSPPLPSGPSASADVDFGITWRLKDDASADGDGVTVWAFNDVTMERWIGFVPNTITITGGGGQEVRVTMTGPIYRRDVIMGSTLTSGINDTDTTAPVANEYSVPTDIASGTKVRMLLADGTNEEVVDVTASNGSGDLTITRNVLSAGAFSFSSGAYLLPYHPEPTLSTEDPLPGTLGAASLWSGSDETEIRSSQWTLEINRNLIQRTGVYGQEYALDGYIEPSGGREVTMTLSGWAYSDSSLPWAARGTEVQPAQAVLRAGSTEGRVVLLEAPLFYIDEPSIERGADDITLDLAGDCVGTLAVKRDELFIGLL